MARTAAGEPNRDALQLGLRIMVVVQGVFLAPLVVWAEPMTQLVLGPGYEESAQVLRALAPFAFMIGISPMLALSVNYLGEARRRVPIAIAALLINAAIDVALLGQIGIVAGAIGTDVAYGFYVAAHLLILRALIGLALRPIGVGIGRSLIAAAAMAGVLALIGTGEVALGLLILGALVGPFVYVLALLAVRAVTPAELRQAAGRVRGMLRPSAT
jgi:O-antigen/teichoic acid export membrane protein